MQLEHLHPPPRSTNLATRGFLFMNGTAEGGRSARPEEFEAKLFGGGRMFEGRPQQFQAGCVDVSCKNVLTGRTLVRQHGLKLKAEHLGGRGHRNLIFDIWSGDAYLKFWGLDAEEKRLVSN